MRPTQHHRSTSEAMRSGPGGEPTAYHVVAVPLLLLLPQHSCGIHLRRDVQRIAVLLPLLASEIRHVSLRTRKSGSVTYLIRLKVVRQERLLGHLSKPRFDVSLVLTVFCVSDMSSEEKAGLLADPEVKRPASVGTSSGSVSSSSAPGRPASSSLLRQPDVIWAGTAPPPNPSGSRALRALEAANNFKDQL
jgi:hypothetical protein